MWTVRRWRWRLTRKYTGVSDFYHTVGTTKTLLVGVKFNMNMYPGRSNTINYTPFAFKPIATTNKFNHVAFPQSVYWSVNHSPRPKIVSGIHITEEFNVEDNNILCHFVEDNNTLRHKSCYRLAWQGIIALATMTKNQQLIKMRFFSEEFYVEDNNILCHVAEDNDILSHRSCYRLWWQGIITLATTTKNQQSIKMLFFFRGILCGG